MTKKTTGQKIKEKRIERGLTQAQLGSLCEPKMKDSAIRRYESGKVNPKIETLQRIAKALDVPVVTLRDDLEIELEEIQTKAKIWMESFKDEMDFLNFLFSLGYEYIDTFHNNDYGFDRCIHIKSENIDIPLTKDEYGDLKKSIAKDVELEIYRLRKNKGL